MSTVPIDPAEHENPASGGGWISGPMIDPAEDARPEFSPHAAVFQLIDVLAAAGIVVRPNAPMIHTAALAAGDLLRALGVRPASAPNRDRR